jgi:hypothetical protein
MRPRRQNELNAIDFVVAKRRQKKLWECIIFAVFSFKLRIVSRINDYQYSLSLRLRFQRLNRLTKAAACRLMRQPIVIVPGKCLSIEEWVEKYGEQGSADRR